MKTSELTGAALDWAVAKCEGVSFVWLETEYSTDGRTFQRGTAQIAGPSYSTNWAHGGPIIEREGISVDRMGCAWTADIADSVGGYIEHTESGPTPLTAAMRCYVASKMGDHVNVPKELIQ